jgi:ribosomal-protein-alanine N-acetyltransferase
MPTDSRTQVILRKMILDDLDEVVELDRISFPSPWPARTYRYEIMDNDRACMFVLEPGEPSASPNGSQPRSFWERLLGGEHRNGSGRLIGYSGMWHIVDEAHISTIAISPEWRGKKLGELLLWSMIRQAIRQGAAQVTLEVRVSNALAQNLYRKYGFEVLGVRKGYYRDNSEDAYNMGLMALDAGYRERMVTAGRELARLFRVDDRW